jgi:hypothetical protein
VMRGIRDIFVRLGNPASHTIGDRCPLTLYFETLHGSLTGHESFACVKLNPPERRVSTTEACEHCGLLMQDQYFARLIRSSERTRKYQNIHVTRPHTRYSLFRTQTPETHTSALKHKVLCEGHKLNHASDSGFQFKLNLLISRYHISATVSMYAPLPSNDNASSGQRCVYL